ncbi:hypothetical protein MKW94_020150 [Papaver nudicaule]|uniref:C2H2-type domain-containing protein n=1 Tax=Papaver nudicaule TaxID=74823 RepID=A0AA41S959_PAPNU|nr:hypothetical protein [Papaver nudicaule]
MHLWSLSNSLSSANREKDATTRSPKKRKLEDILCTEDGSKKARLGKKKNDLEVIHKQTPVYSSASDKYRCDNCGRPFSSHQALGGHKSSCNIYFRKNEAGESSAQGSMRNQNNKIDESSKDFASSTAHRCKVCFKCFPSGQALGGHQKSHPQVKPQIGSLLSLSAPNEEVRKESLSVKEPLVSWSSSVSQPMNISVDSLCPINSMASVQEEQDDVMNKMNISVDPLCPVNPSTSVEEAQEDGIKNKKINMMFDLNEVPPEDEDELDLKV